MCVNNAHRERNSQVSATSSIVFHLFQVFLYYVETVVHDGGVLRRSTARERRGGGIFESSGGGGGSILTRSKTQTRADKSWDAPRRRRRLWGGKFTVILWNVTVLVWNSHFLPDGKKKEGNKYKRRMLLLPGQHTRHTYISLSLSLLRYVHSYCRAPTV